MTAAAADAPPLELEFELAVSKRAAVIRHKADERDQERYDKLPDVPASHRPFTGTYAEVAARAKQLNEGQLRNSFLDYLYYPDIVGAKPVPAGGTVSG
ncbi:MAG: hypothetical protein K0S37_3582 [Microbacterium sp.]|nr:hypothetical protein [Microbacterium sp.]